MESSGQPVGSGNLWRKAAADFTGGAIRVFARLLTAVRAEWRGSAPSSSQRIYFANHNSHGDFILIWSVLPTWARRRIRPVAGADYWGGKGLRRFVGTDVFNTVLIERQRESRTTDPIATMADVLDAGASLVIFPEGTRNLTEETLLPFKGGIYHLARARPQVELVPVWIENLNRVLPKGEIIPVPIMCKVVFGTPMQVQEGEDKDTFLQRARMAMLALHDRADAPSDDEHEGGA